MRIASALTIASWTAVIFGLIEGAVLCITRAYPALLAPYKISAHVLWIAPVVDLAVFLLAVLGLLTLLKLLRKWISVSEPFIIVFGFCIFLGIFTVITAPKLIHTISAAILSLGLAVACCRQLRGIEERLARYLRARLALLPALIVILGLSVLGYETARERWLFHRLPSPPHHAENVLVIVMDTVRHDSFTSRAEKSLTPNLNRIVAHGVMFENAWATSSWSLPTQASILTGRYPHDHGADWPHLRLDKRYPTLAEFFSAQGYVTGAFSGNATWITPEYLGDGFLRFDVYGLEDHLRRSVLGRMLGRLLDEVGYHHAGRGKAAPVLNAQFLKFLDDYQGRPFFAYLCYMDVNRTFHNRWLNYGFLAHAPMQEVFQAYEQGLGRLDQHLGELFDELTQRDMLKNTLVVITSDHGQSFFGSEATDDHTPAGHGTSLFPEQTRVPLFLFNADKHPAGRRVIHPVSIREIPALITHELGLVAAPFMSERKSPLENRHSPVLSTLHYDGRDIQSVIWNEWQYIKNLDHSQPSEELYNLADDPLAKQNLAPMHPLLPVMQGLLQQLLSSSS